MINPTVITSGKTSSGDNSSFYGLNAGVLAASGSTLNIYGGTVTTSGIGANGVFATGSGTVVTLSNVTIVCTGQLGHGVDATVGGTLYLTDVDIATGPGANSAAIATDRGGGTLEVQGSLASTEVSVASGAVLGGTGTLAGNLTVQSGGSLLLSATGNLKVSGNITLDGNLTVVPASATLADGTYRLLAHGGSLSGLPVFAYESGGKNKQTAVVSTNTSGVITVTLSGGSASSAQLGFSRSGDRLVCEWPSSCLGWTLQAQTNSVGSGLGTHWVRIPSSAVTNLMSLPLDTSVGSVFYRLLAP